MQKKREKANSSVAQLRKRKLTATFGGGVISASSLGVEIFQSFDVKGNEVEACWKIIVNALDCSMY